MKRSPLVVLPFAVLALFLPGACGEAEPPPAETAAPRPERAPGWRCRVLELSGGVTTPDGAPTRGSAVDEGTTLRVPAGGRLVLEFRDGAKLVAPGPVRFAVVEMTDYAVTVDLREGSLERVESKDITTGITVGDARFVAFENGAVRAERGPDHDEFELIEGEDAKAVVGRRIQALEPGIPFRIPR